MLTPFLTLTLGEEVDQSRNTVSSCVFHSVWPGDSERLFLSGVGEQQWLEWTEQSIAAPVAAEPDWRHTRFPLELVWVSLTLFLASLAAFSHQEVNGDIMILFSQQVPTGDRFPWRPNPEGPFWRGSLSNKVCKYWKREVRRSSLWFDGRWTHMRRGNVQGSTLSSNKNKQNSKTLECCYSAQANSSGNHRSTEYPTSMKWGKHSGGRLWPCLGGASSWEWSLQTVTQGAGWRKLYTPAEGRPEGANLFLTWLLYCSKINSKESVLFLWMMDGTWSIVLVLNLGQRRSLKYGSQKSILQQWWAKRTGWEKKTEFYSLG